MINNQCTTSINATKSLISWTIKELVWGVVDDSQTFACDFS